MCIIVIDALLIAKANVWLFKDATITVLSQNGSIDLESHEVRLLYSRRENDRTVARIVAERDGVVKAQVAPRDDGKDQAEAFKALRKHVEMCLDRILQEVPGAISHGKADLGFGPGPSRAPAISPAALSVSPTGVTPGQSIENRERLESQGRVALPMDAPPAYGKAVRDWRSSNDEKKN